MMIGTNAELNEIAKYIWQITRSHGVDHYLIQDNALYDCFVLAICEWGLIGYKNALVDMNEEHKKNMRENIKTLKGKICSLK